MQRNEGREGAMSTFTVPHTKERRLSNEKLPLPSRREAQSVDMTRKNRIYTDSPVRSMNPELSQQNTHFLLDDYFDNEPPRQSHSQLHSQQMCFQPVEPSQPEKEDK